MGTCNTLIFWGFPIADHHPGSRLDSPGCLTPIACEAGQERLRLIQSWGALPFGTPLRRMPVPLPRSASSLSLGIRAPDPPALSYWHQRAAEDHGQQQCVAVRFIHDGQERQSGQAAQEIDVAEHAVGPLQARRLRRVQ